jgi:hypothetical protein
VNPRVPPSGAGQLTSLIVGLFIGAGLASLAWTFPHACLTLSVFDTIGGRASLGAVVGGALSWIMSLLYKGLTLRPTKTADWVGSGGGAGAVVMLAFEVTLCYLRPASCLGGR